MTSNDKAKVAAVTAKLTGGRYITVPTWSMSINDAVYVQNTKTKEYFTDVRGDRVAFAKLDAEKIVRLYNAAEFEDKSSASD